MRNHEYKGGPGNLKRVHAVDDLHPARPADAMETTKVTLMLQSTQICSIYGFSIRTRDYGLGCIYTYVYIYTKCSYTYIHMCFTSGC